MRRSARLIVLGAVLLAIVLALVACAPPDATQSPGYVSGDGTVTEWAPDERDEPIELTGTTFDGEAISVSDLRGEVVVLNTWYAACPPCRIEAPDLVELDTRPDVHLIGINTRDDAPTAAAFERTFGVEYPSIDDADGQAVAQLQGVVAVNAVPTTVVLDTEGRVAARIIGRAEASTLNALVDAAGSSPVDGSGQ